MRHMLKSLKNIGVFESKGTPRHPRFVFAGSLAALYVSSDVERHDTTHGTAKRLRGQGQCVSTSGENFLSRY